MMACFSGWPVWEMTVDNVQRTTEEAVRLPKYGSYIVVTISYQLS